MCVFINAHTRAIFQTNSENCDSITMKKIPRSLSLLALRRIEKKANMKQKEKPKSSVYTFIESACRVVCTERLTKKKG